MRAAPFAQWVAKRFPQPEDAIAAYLDDAKAAAASVWCSLDAAPLLDQSVIYLPNLEGQQDKRQYVRASLEQDPDGTLWPCLTFKTFRHGGDAVMWKPRNLAWEEFQRDKGGEPANDNGERLEAYRAQAARRVAEAKAKAAEREADEKRGREAAAKAAKAAWEAASDDAGAHPYLTRKNVPAYGLRIATQETKAKLRDSDGVWKMRTVASPGDLLIPLVGDDGEVSNLQRISAAGVKLFVTGGRVSGLRHIIPGDASAPTWLAEGYATGASVRQATGAGVVVAFSAGNLAKVAHLAQLVAADNDAHGAGQEKASKTGLPWVAPEGVKDWNDYAAAQGLEATAAALGRIQQKRDEGRRAQQKAENARLQKVLAAPLPPSMEVAQMERDCVWIAEGSMVGRISDPQQVLSFPDFAGLTASSVTKIADEKGKAKSIPNAILWKQSERRQTVLTRTFQAGAGAICYDPDGKLALNSWRPIQRRPAAADIGPFLGQVEYLFPDQTEREAFLNWLAHLEQRPGELPHYGWLHIAANTGTGRNWLASVLSRIWRGSVAPNVDLPSLLDSQYNGQLAGRVLAIVDEIQEAAGENPYRHTNRLKSLVNSEFRDLNPKFGRQYREHNACRWLVFSNHDNALPLNDTDRRWRVVRHNAAPRSPSDYAKLYALLGDPEFINAVGVFLAERDISGFNPGERPPMSDAKRAALAASKTMTQQYAQQLVKHWPTDVLTNADAAQVLSEGAENKFTPAMRRALEELGCVSVAKTLKLNGQVHRCWIIRNHEKWLGESSANLGKEARKELGTESRPAALILADAISSEEDTARDTRPF